MRDYTPGQTYELSSFGDLIQVYRKLPKERGDLMLTEVCQMVRYSAAYADLLGAVTFTVPPVRWIDDDQGHTDVNAHFADGGTLSLEVRPDKPEAA